MEYTSAEGAGGGGGDEGATGRRSSSVYITNLPRIREFSEADLASLFTESGFAAPSSTTLHRYKSGVPKGSAVVKFDRRGDAEACIKGCVRALRSACLH